MAKSVALIVIANGLGHLRRQLAFYEYLITYGYNVTLLCNAVDLKKLNATYVNSDHLELRVADLPRLVKAGFFERMSSSLEKYDIVVSDNCVDVLRSRSDAVLFASFLWHRSIDMPDWYGEESEELIALNNPVIIADHLFVADYLQCYSNLVRVGFFGQPRLESGNTSRDVLLSFGFSTARIEYFCEILDCVVKFCLRTNRKLWVEPRYFPLVNTDSRLIVEATYTKAMFTSVGLGIIRPGLGTLTELVGAGSRIICVYEQKNEEMVFNARRISEDGLGYDAPSIGVLAELLDSYDRLTSIRCDTPSQYFGGESQALQAITSLG